MKKSTKEYQLVFLVKASGEQKREEAPLTFIAPTSQYVFLSIQLLNSRHDLSAEASADEVQSNSGDVSPAKFASQDESRSTDDAKSEPSSAPEPSSASKLSFSSSQTLIVANEIDVDSDYEKQLEIRRKQRAEREALRKKEEEAYEREREERKREMEERRRYSVELTYLEIHDKGTATRA